MARQTGLRLIVLANSLSVVWAMRKCSRTGRRAELYLAEARQLDVDPGPQPRSQVGGAGEDIAQPLVPHELPSLLHDQSLHLPMPRAGHRTSPN